MPPVIRHLLEHEVVSTPQLGKEVLPPQEE
jgi:hypothetical protein